MTVLCRGIACFHLFGTFRVFCSHGHEMSQTECHEIWIDMERKYMYYIEHGKCGHMHIWKYGNMEMKYGNMEMKYGNMEIR